MGAVVTDSSLYGLILTGGRSSRMGSDKALINYHGKPQREFLFLLLEKYCAKVFISCREEQHVAEQLNPLTDHYHFQSPLNGILSAFRLFPDKRWVIIAVDMPNINERAIEKLVGESDLKKIATCFINPDENAPEPLLTLWEPSAYPLLLQFMRLGNIGPRDFLKMHPIHMLELPDHKLLLNVNSPDQIPLEEFPE
jgi:molybdenum cofactor guanylyltransferase